MLLSKHFDLSFTNITTAHGTRARKAYHNHRPQQRNSYTQMRNTIALYLAAILFVNPYLVVLAKREHI